MRRDGAGGVRLTEEGNRMTIRTRKLVGTALLMALLTVYALLVMAVAIVLQVNDSKWVEFAFYVIGGLAWVMPAALLIKWMLRPDEPARTK
jgi:F0F1-type ATP synthase assembly protein I